MRVDVRLAKLAPPKRIWQSKLFVLVILSSFLGFSHVRMVETVTIEFLVSFKSRKYGRLGVGPTSEINWRVFHGGIHTRSASGMTITPSTLGEGPRRDSPIRTCVFRDRKVRYRAGWFRLGYVKLDYRTTEAEIGGPMQMSFRSSGEGRSSLQILVIGQSPKHG